MMLLADMRKSADVQTLSAEISTSSLNINELLLNFEHFLCLAVGAGAGVINHSNCIF